MRIGLDLTPLCVPQTGVGTYAQNLWDQLRVRPDDDVRPLAHRPWPPVAAPPRRPVNKTLWMQLLLPAQLRRLGLDVCHFTNNVGPAWTPIPSVVTLHDMTLWLYPEYHYPRRIVSMRPFIPAAARHARAVIAVSHSTARDAIRLLRLPPAKVHVIPEAPGPAFRPLPPGAVAAFRQAQGLPERFVLYVGTLEPRKNLDRLLEALARLRRPDVALVLAGQRGWKDAPVFAALERLGLGDRVRLLGHVSTPTLVGLYNAAQVFAFPSLYEGFGLPVIEAMACGTPVVTSTAGALRETAADAAEYVDPHDSDSIAAGLARVLDDAGRRADLRARGLARASQLSWARTAALTRGVYEQALAPIPAALTDPRPTA